jgi:cobalamin biosynthesis protein CobT
MVFKKDKNKFERCNKNSLTVGVTMSKVTKGAKVDTLKTAVAKKKHKYTILALTEYRLCNKHYNELVLGQETTPNPSKRRRRDTDENEEENEEDNEEEDNEEEENEEEENEEEEMEEEENEEEEMEEEEMEEEEHVENNGNLIFSKSKFLLVIGFDAALICRF